jgi:hypothetical protein
MRPVHVSDVLALARFLLGHAEGEHATVARALIAQTQVADEFRQKFGYAHPVWGDGSIGSCVRGQTAPEPVANTIDHLFAISNAANALRNALSQTELTQSIGVVVKMPVRLGTNDP